MTTTTTLAIADREFDLTDRTSRLAAADYVREESAIVCKVHTREGGAA